MIAGSIAQRPGRAGHAWVFLQYLLGFQRLGWDVLFLDRMTADMVPGDETQTDAPFSRNIAWLERVMRFAGLDAAYSLALPDNSRRGLEQATVERRARQADLLIDVNGFLGDDDLLAMTPLPVFLDIDPGFNQMWWDLGLADVLAGHDAFVTVAQQMGQQDCLIPTCERSWITTRPPVVLDHWPVAPPQPNRPFTTITTWRGPFAPVEYKGHTYGLRVHEFRRFMSLPKLTGDPFELALDIDPADQADIDALRTSGWAVIDPTAISFDLDGYQRYISESKAEFSIAKSMYVQTRSGWFSDRSACYLATGRPVVVQDTGFEGDGPLESAVLIYSSLEEAVEAVKIVRTDYRRQSRAAADLARDLFESGKVLQRLVGMLGATSVSQS